MASKDVKQVAWADATGVVAEQHEDVCAVAVAVAAETAVEGPAARETCCAT